MPQDYRELTQEEKEIVINNYAQQSVTDSEADILRSHYVGVRGALKDIHEKYYITFWFEIPSHKQKSKIWLAQYFINNNFVRRIREV